MISNTFNDVFVNVGQTLAKSIPSSCKEPSDYIWYNAINAFCFDPVTENEISKIIGCFKESAAGLDNSSMKPVWTDHLWQAVSDMH